MQKIIEEDNIYYKIPSDQLFKQYTYARPDVFNITSDDIFDKIDSIKEYIEKGNIGYLAIKDGAEDLFNLSEEDYVTILPLKDELYTMLKANSGDKTEIVQAWELRMVLPESNMKNIIKRYLSFEDYLKDFKHILIQNSKFLVGKDKDIVNSKLRKINYLLALIAQMCDYESYEGSIKSQRRRLLVHSNCKTSTPQRAIAWPSSTS